MATQALILEILTEAKRPCTFYELDKACLKRNIQNCKHGLKTLIFKRKILRLRKGIYALPGAVLHSELPNGKIPILADGAAGRVNKSPKNGKELR